MSKTSRCQPHNLMKGLSLTKDHLQVPSHPFQDCSTRISHNHRSLLSDSKTTPMRPSEGRVLAKFVSLEISDLTFLILQVQPRLFSWGQLDPNVIIRALSKCSADIFSRISQPSSLSNSMATLIAHPQSGACFKCSTMALSPASHPSRLLWQRKHDVLSGLPSVG